MSAHANASDTIRVEFYEGRSDAPFAASDMPVDQLPDTFEVRTTLEIGAEDWIVLRAEPAQKAGFRATGTLKLYLARPDIQTIDPRHILYSLPTINDRLPAVEDALSLEDTIVFSEDDWRQFEFVAVHHAQSIEDEFASISKIYDDHRQGVGFRKIHVREKIELPLSPTALTLGDITNHFKISRKHAGVAFDTAAATVSGGFALSTDSGWVLWGQIDDDGTVLTFNLNPTDEALIDGFSQEVDAFMEAQGLFAIDWVRLFWSGPGYHPFADYAD